MSNRVSGRVTAADVNTIRNVIYLIFKIINWYEFNYVLRIGVLLF